jgi:hypothetical protein
VQRPLSIVMLIIGMTITMTFVAWSKPQEPSITVEQCRADGDAWKKISEAAADAQAKIAHAGRGDDIRKFDAAFHYLKRFPLSEISRRTDEMATCTQVDRQNQDMYLFVGVFLESEESNRYMNFLLRHNLWNDFVAEDAQGKR